MNLNGVYKWFKLIPDCFACPVGGGGGGVYL
jgi:hypothetical protein